MKSKFFNDTLGPFLVLILIAGTSLRAQSQTRLDYSDTEIAGQVNLAFNDKRIFINLGGPSLEIIKSKYRYGITVYPSVQYFESNAQLVLGVGPHFIQKTWVYSLPVFFTGDASYLSVSVGRAF